jgi:hypothetical protein
LDSKIIDILPDELTPQQFDEIVQDSRFLDLSAEGKAKTIATTLNAALYTRVDAENKTVYVKGMHTVNHTGFELIISLNNEDKLYAIIHTWPAAAKYITISGLLNAYKESKQNATLNDWEFEAQQCERVEEAVGRINPNRFPACPDCGCQKFLVAPQILVDFTVPFVHSGRVTMLGFTPGQKLNNDTVKCVRCRAVFPRKA